MPHLGVCSWSLEPKLPTDLGRDLAAVGLAGCQLALDPVRTGSWSLEGVRAGLGDVRILSGMMSTEGEDYTTIDSIARTGGVRPDKTWGRNLAAARENARLAEELGLSLVTLHAGFLPEERADPERAKLLERLGQLARAFGERGVRVGLETGQESSATLLEVLDELGEPNLGVNFDPANMLLYGTGDPIEALVRLGPRVFQVHVKDARRSESPGTWGQEVPVGEGQVDWTAFFDALRDHAVEVDLVIEREAGDQRVADIRTAAEHARTQLARIGWSAR